jgi:amino acid adenylation domain-containing protein
VTALNENEPVLIGRPISGTEVFILSAENRLCPVLVPGEIYISGAGVGKAYLNKPELTSGRFVPNSFREGTTMYKTGDVGRWLPDGNIQFLGRKDEQIKIRGYRIEPAEIEEALRSYQSIQNAIVVAHVNNTGEKELVAYFISHEPVSASQLQAYLVRMLPSYMLPAHYVQIDQLPLTSNGKIDKKKLPHPAQSEIDTGVPYEAPQNETEKQLAAIWADILGKEKIGVQDDFFTLGGHSLKTIRLVGQIYKSFEVKIEIKDIFTHSTLKAQALLIEHTQETPFVSIPVLSEEPDYVLSSAQRRLYISGRTGAARNVYTVPGTYIFEGDLNRQALDLAFSVLIKRHEILRTVFKENAQGETRQIVYAAEEADFSIYYLDLRQSENREVLARDLIQQDSSRAFDLSEGPLLRAGLYQVADKRWIFNYVMHHIISDAWSMKVLIKELLVFYNAYIKGEERPLEPLRIQYKDYAAWQQQQLQGASLQRHKQYWLQQFSGSLPVLELPTDRVRPAVKTYNGACVQATINSTVSNALGDLCRQQGSTLFMGLLSAVNVLLYRYSGQDDIVIGSSIASREHSDLENQIGFYVNTLALRSRFSGSDSYLRVLEHVKQVTLGAYEHQVYPFDELVEALDIEHDKSRSFLFDVMVVLENTAVTDSNAGEGNATKLGDISVSPYEAGGDVVSKFDITFFFCEAGNALQLNVVYNRDLYSADSMQRLVGHLQQLLQIAIDSPGTPVSQLDYISAEEKQQLQIGFSESSIAYPDNKTVVDLFEEQAARTPDAIALVYEGEELTYRQVDERSGRLAHYLRSNYVLAQDDVVGIMLNRSSGMIIAMLGIMRSGAAYVAIDADIPRPRKEFILKDTGAKALITQSDHLFDVDFFQGGIIALDIQLEEMNGGVLAPVSRDAGSLAYIVYTSGSTGVPKGVMITHQSVVDYVYGIMARTNMAACKSFGLVSTIAADLGNTVIYSCLLTGGALHVFSETAVMHGEKMAASQIDCLKIVPSHWKALQRTDKLFAAAKCLVFGGEPLTTDIIETLKKQGAACNVYNHYGPSETTIGKLIKQIDLSSASIDITLGSPFCNSQVYILDAAGRLVPVGVAGEICIGGDGVARGYLNQPALTAEKFVNNPFRPGERMYRTGDLGRWTAQGDIEFMGRKDDQIKIRGYRVELNEIALALLDHPQIAGAVVIVKSKADGDKELIAYVVSEATINAQDLRLYLSSSLPAYMIPVHFVQLPELPLTANGKVDRKKLPDVEELTDANYVAPRNATEEKLVQLWREVLGKEKIGVKDNFFEIGGHSLRAIRLVSLIQKEFEVNIGLKEIFEALDPEQQAELIANAQKKEFITISPVAEQPDYVLSSSQRRLWVLSQFEGANIAYNVPAAYVFEGDLDRAALESCFNTLITRHEILRTVFREREEGEIRQVILSTAATGFEIRYNDLRSEQDVEKKVNELVQYEFTKPFNLYTGPLLRVRVIQVALEKYVVTYVMHHIISDGWSKGILIRQLLALYNACVKNLPDPLSPLRIQYKDYAAWEQEQLSDQLLENHKQYWLQQFSGELPVLDLHSDRQHPPVKTYNGGIIRTHFSQDVNKGIRALSDQQGGTLFMGLLAVVNVLLYKYTSAEDIIIATPIAGREHADLQDQIGFYINTLVLRTPCKGHQGYKDVLAEIKQVVLQAYEHQVYPFDKLVNELNLRRDMSRHPLTDIMVALQNIDDDHKEQEANNPHGLKVSGFRGGEHVVSKFDLQFDFVETAGVLQLNLEYNSDIFNRETVERLLANLEQIMLAVISQPDIAVSRLEFISLHERHQLLESFNATSVAWPHDKTLVDLFREQAGATPSKIALVFKEQTVSYGELDRRSDQLALYLQRLGVTAGTLVPLFMERSAEMVVAMLGIMKAGGAYVPIDLSYPVERIAYIVQDCSAHIVISSAHTKHRLTSISGITVIIPEDEPLQQEAAAVDRRPGLPGPHDLAYVIYTSGSTGTPKGVLIEHRGMVNHLFAKINELGINDKTVLAFTAAYTFDISVWQLFAALVCGGQTIIYPDELIYQPGELLRAVSASGVTILELVPAYLSVALEQAGEVTFNQLHYLLVTGEVVKRSVLAQWFASYSGIPVVNAYGPTEASDDICHHIMHTVPVTDSVPVGKPIQNMRIYILNEAGQLCAVGVPGEICVAGVGVGRGYLNQPALTAEKFVADPFAAQQGTKMYRTGDRGRWLPDGTIDYLGRMDSQVKIRGYRIELGEIEEVLQLYSGVSQAVVLAVEDGSGNKRLVGYIVPSGDFDKEGILNYLQSKLPAYMIPALLIPINKLPLTANGKTDHRSLPAVDHIMTETERAYVAPRNETEETLVMIWRELLGKENIGVRDSFFDLGGHSIKAIQLISRIQAAFSVRLNVETIFRDATIENISERIQFILDQNRQKSNKEELRQIEI